MIDELFLALCDEENQPHQWIGDHISLKIAFAQVIRREFPELGCPNWGRQPDGRIGGCEKCFVCKLFSNL